MEECVDAANFLSLLASSIFFSFGLFNLIIVPIFHPEIVSPIVRAEWIGGALIALLVVWILYEVRTRLVLVAVILFALSFSFSMYVSMYIGMTVDFKLDAVPSPAIAYLSVLLGYVDYRLVSAAWSVSRISEAERLIVRGTGRPTIQGFLLRLLGIPAICEWLDGPQRRFSVALFFLSTSAFCFFVTSALSVLIVSVPEVGIYSVEMARELGVSVPISLLFFLAAYPAALGLVSMTGRPAGFFSTVMLVKRDVAAAPASL